MSRGPDAATLLHRALAHHAERAGCSVAITESRLTRWASATFVGARHCLTLSGHDDAALAAWLADLPEIDLPLRGHLVADLVIAGTTRGCGHAAVAIEALTVEV